MKKRAISALLALALLLSTLPALAVNLDYNAGKKPPAVGMNFTTGIVRNLGANSNSLGTARQLEVSVSVPSTAPNNANVYAMVMLAEDYKKLVETDVTQNSLGTDKFASYQATAGYYAIGSGAVKSGETELIIPLTATGDLQDVLAGSYNGRKNFPTTAIGTNENAYYKELVLVLFDTHTKTGTDSYYVDYFELDYEGYVRSPSYAVRYHAQGGTGAKSPVIVRGKDYSTLKDLTLAGKTPDASSSNSDGTPVRSGYTFLGWSVTAASQTVQYDSGKGMTFAKPAEEDLYKITDLYAVWKENPVAVKAEEKDITGPAGKVGVEYNSETYTLDTATDNSKSDARSGKTYTVAKTVYAPVDGDETTIPQDELGTNGMPVGLSIKNTNTNWSISGTPGRDSAQPIKLYITVKDNANNTQDTFTYTIPSIEKGAQATPELDWNTALQGRSIMTGEGDEESKVGQIIGFYSPNEGAPDYSGKVYEYVPKTVFDAAQAGGKTQDELDLLWRPVSVDGESDPDSAWEGYGTIQAATPGDWVKGENVGKALEVTGLEADAEYYVRFRATDTYTASDSVTVSTSGATASGEGGTTTGGPSVSFHLAGGSLPPKEEESGETVDFTFLYQDLTEGEQVPIPAVEPVREGYTFDGWTDGETTYRYDPDADPAVTVTATDGPLTLAARWIAGTDSFCSVVFYDWDGTLLGTRIVAKGGTLLGDHETPDQRGDGANQAPMPPEYELLWDVNEDKEYTFISNNNAGNDVANKMGYTFAGWVDNETGYSVPNVAASASSGQAIPAEDLVSLTNVQENLVLKAAYSETSLIAGNINQRRYLISYTPFTLENGALVTEITVRRPQNARRAPEGNVLLRISLQPLQRGQTIVSIPLGAGDVETVSFSMPIGTGEYYNSTRAITLNVFSNSGTQMASNTYIGASTIEP